MKATILFILSVLICANFVLADEPTSAEPDWKDKTSQVFDQTVDGAKKVGEAIAENAKSGYVSTKEYFSNRTVGDVASDVAEGAKNAGNAIANEAEKAWKGISGWFS